MKKMFRFAQARFKQALAPRTLKLGVAALCGLGSLGVVGGANAAEITLYENNGYSGRSITIRGYTPSLADFGFNDRARSFVVRSGSWQLCSESEFRGECIDVGPGQYVELDRRLANRISSVRERGSYSNSTDYSYGQNYQRGSIDIFENRNFSGASIRLDRNQANFADIGFNDRAQSLIVNEGMWEVCQHMGFKGTCRRYGPGRYNDLGYGMVREISSARMVTNYQNAPVIIESPAARGEGVGGATVGSAPIGRVVLFSGDAFRGESMVVAQATIDLQPTGFNDRTQSYVVEEGAWEFCSDHQFRGTCEIVAPGQYRRASNTQFRATSSLRPVAPVSARDQRSSPGWQRRPNAPQVELFSEVDFRGERYDTNTDIYNFDAIRMNDRIRSMVIYSGAWEVCEHAEFRGECRVYGRGQHNDLYNFNGRISSMRKIQQ